MSDNVKISALELENVKRIKAIQLVPTESGLTVIIEDGTIVGQEVEQ